MPPTWRSRRPSKKRPEESLILNGRQGERLPISVNPPSVQKLEDVLTCLVDESMSQMGQQSICSYDLQFEINRDT